MIVPIRTTSVDYPESDGLPSAENTVQYRWITTIKGGLDAVFRSDPNVFIAGDLFWYPVEGDNTIRVAPDVLVAFGRPKGDRGSYMQWVEEGISPQVVFEILSPSNRPDELRAKLEFYERYSVEEYYQFDPETSELLGWLRENDALVSISQMNEWISPRLGVRFDLSSGDLQVFGPDGKLFVEYVVLAERCDNSERNAERAQREAERMNRELQSEREMKDRERKEKESAMKRAEALAAKLRAMGVDPDA